jgi:hypothetical protein
VERRALERLRADAEALLEADLRAALARAFAGLAVVVAVAILSESPVLPRGCEELVRDYLCEPLAVIPSEHMFVTRFGEIVTARS